LHAEGLSAAPGLAPITVSPRALERLRNRNAAIDAWYLDLKLLDEYFEGPKRYHHTPPVTLFYGLAEALGIIRKEGVRNRWNRHRHAHDRFVRAMREVGLEMLVSDVNRIWNLNTPRVPDGVSDVAVRNHLIEHHGIEILGGFGQLAGKVFRIGIMGPLANNAGVDNFVSAFSEALAVNGYPAAALTH
jgi:alanine-glyoxylate transaminase/serine-glyoxylate transaminase/serine-pyruvate transaminase